MNVVEFVVVYPEILGIVDDEAEIWWHTAIVSGFGRCAA